MVKAGEVYRDVNSGKLMEIMCIDGMNAIYYPLEELWCHIGIMSLYDTSRWQKVADQKNPAMKRFKDSIRMCAFLKKFSKEIHARNSQA